MCGGGGGGYDAGQASRDREQARLEAEQQRLAAENLAQQEANAATAARRVRARSNTLMTRGARGAVPMAESAPGAPAMTSTVMAQGAATLGGAKAPAPNPAKPASLSSVLRKASGLLSRS